MLATVVTARENGLDIEVAGERVLVATREHKLDVVTSQGVRWELGASHAGVRAMLNVIEDSFAPERLALEDRHAIATAATVALRKAAARAEKRAAKTERQIDAIRPTPLVYAPSFLASQYLRADAESFRPARVAIALLEDNSFDNATPEGADALVSVLERWRDIYGQSGSAKKAISKTLAQFGEDLTTEALWGLRRVRLSRVAQSLEHAEVLGTFGAHATPTQSARVIPAVEHATPEDLERALDAVERSRLVASNPTNALAELLLGLGEARVITDSLLGLLEVALDNMRRQMDRGAPTALPPIPLPKGGGIRFLATCQQVIDEGRHMNHCVATRFWDAFEGNAYLFHVSTQYGDVTVQMNTDGTVYEARGPDNGHHPGVEIATAALLRWGQGLVFAGLDMNASTWRGGPSVPNGAQALKRVSDCVDVHSRALERVLFSERDTWTDWFVHHVFRASRGDEWLVWSMVDTLPVVSVLNDRGRVVEQSSAVLSSGGYRSFGKSPFR